MSMETLRKKAVQGLKKGDTFVIERTFSQAETLAFGEMTKDYNPVHYEDEWVKTKGFNGRICHGLLVGAMICEFGGQVAWLATGMNFRFLHPVYFEDTIRLTVTLVDIQEDGRAEADGVFINQSKELVARVTLYGRLPVGDERDLLKSIDASVKLPETMSKLRFK